ncbi:ATP-dependent RNA helicase RhlE [Kordia periserrulae]|uniref:DEAD-box ATP-dependent RNA helicase RhpA n=1 Tax=Kordia periserrulae TaxID=701523 RepID=A0A2T6C036_9FLAO|nr:DEAD/DEAH box helicase [Kordia periserrulae]PTX61682.1 ATP-dependent RNA helicase RhlE [Kordia periserrulae]
MSFKSLGLSDALLRAISKKGYTTPSPIQAKAIPLVLERKDVLASAQTGTGKTAGFTLPILQLLSQEPPLRRRPIRALILTPTRELAAQVYANVQEYSTFLDIRSTVIFGGVNAKPQIRTLRNGVDILVATPGRLLDLHSQNALSLAKVEMLVLDEADRMLDMGFLRDIKRVIDLMPKRRQNLLFSATFSKDIKKLANSILHNPVSVEATPENTTAEKVNQIVYKVNKPEKTNVLIKLISDGNWSQVLVFTRTKHGANRLTKKLISNHISAAAIHGNKTQNARTKALSGFKKGDIRILVATDIAARGLDIPLLPFVINYELPNVPEDYVHRIGRTGRAGASGDAISLVSAEEYEYVRGIEKLLGEKLITEEIEGFEADPNYTPPPKQERSQRSRNQTKSSSKGTSSRNQNSRKPSNSGSTSSNNKRKNSRSRNRKRD